MARPSLEAVDTRRFHAFKTSKLEKWTPEGLRELGVRIREKKNPEDIEALGILVLEAGRNTKINFTSYGARNVPQKPSKDEPSILKVVRSESVKNQYGEKPIIADVRSEEAMIEVLKATGIRWLIRSEEHGETKLYNEDDGEKPEGVIVLDGKDGSSAAKKYLRGSTDRLHTRYGGMAAIALNPDPTYGEFDFAGYYEDAYQGEKDQIVPVKKLNPALSGRLIYATRGNDSYKGGTFIRTSFEFRKLQIDNALDQEGKNTLELGLTTPGELLEFNYFNLNGSTYDEYADSFNEAFLAYAKDKGIPIAKVLSTGAHFLNFITGSEMPADAIVQPIDEQVKQLEKATRYGEEYGDQVQESIVFVAEPDRKGHEELAANVIMTLMAGGVVRTLDEIMSVDDDGSTYLERVPVDVSNLKYLSWNPNWKTDPRPLPVIAARNAEIADHLLLAC